MTFATSRIDWREPEVPVQLDDGCIRIGADQAAQTLGRRSPESVYRLRGVADNCQAPALRNEQADDVHLQRVHVLVLVDQYIAEPSRELRPELGVREEGVPAQEKIIEVQQSRAALACREIPEQLGDRRQMRLAPRVFRGQQLAEGGVRC